MKPFSRTYVHFADYYHAMRARDNLVTEAEVRRSISTAFRLCLLFSEEVILPASSVFESSYAQSLVRDNERFRVYAVIKMAAGDGSLGDHLESKQGAYDSSTSKYFLDAYHRKGRVLPTYVVRPGSSTVAIGKSWLRALEDGPFLDSVRDAAGTALPVSFEKQWSTIPQDLGGRAFVDIHAAALLEKKGILIPKLQHLIAPIIEEPYISGYKTSLEAWLMVGIPYLSHGPIERRINSGKLIEYRALIVGLERYGLLDRVLRCKSEALFGLWCRRDWDVLASAITSPDSLAEESARIAGDLGAFLDSQVNASQEQLEIGFVHPMTTLPIKADKQRFDAAIIVALPIEAAAMLTLMVDDTRIVIEGDPNLYYSGRILLPNKRAHSVLLCQLPRMGTNAAATSTTNMMRSFDVGQAVVCGIALGVPNVNDVSKHVRLGDVIVSDRAGVVQSDHKAIKDGVETSRSLMQPPPAPLVRILNAIETNLLRGRRPEWDALIDKISQEVPRFARPDASTDVVYANDGKTVLAHPNDPDRDVDHPKLVRGVFASSNTLVKDGAFRDAQASAHGVQAMEMEGAGALEALWAFDGSAMVVKAVCDYGVRKDDRWHSYAALAAAAVTAHIIAEL